MGRPAAAEHAVIEKAWRDETVHKDREVNELATDLDTAARTHQEAVKELKIQVAEGNLVARDNAATAAQARERLVLEANQHFEEAAELKSQLAEARATISTLRQTQEALIARIQPLAS